MNHKSRTVIGWTLTVILAIIFVGSAAMKLLGGDEVVKGMAMVGISKTAITIIGLTELVCIALFVFPRTGLLGTLLLSAYLGGAIATHLEHQQPIFAPVIIQCVLWITATIRFKELSVRLWKGRPLPA